MPEKVELGDLESASYRLHIVGHVGDRVLARPLRGPAVAHPARVEQDDSEVRVGEPKQSAQVVIGPAGTARVNEEGRRTLSL
jgi:hypothetical protein